MIDRVAVILFVVLSLIASQVSAQVTRVQLRSTVRLEPDAALTLGAVADVIGPQRHVVSSIELSSIVGDEDARGWSRIDAERVRELLEQDARVHAGSVVVTGLSSELRRTDATRREDGAAVMEAQEPKITIRGQVERWLYARYDATARTLRYDVTDRDAEFLATDCEGRMLEFRELSKSGRTAIRIVVHNGEVVEHDRSVLLDVELEREVVVANQRITRGTRIEASMV